MAKIARHELGPAADGKVRRFEGLRQRNSPKESYNYLTERMKLTRMLQRPTWVEYPAGANDVLAEYPLIHTSLGNGVEVWIADDDEGEGLLGMDEESRRRFFPDTQWVVVVEHDGQLIAQQRSVQPTLGGLTEAVRMALAQATEDL